MVDAAKDGDCVYIQPGTHTLTDPLFISSRKRIFILGFVESHTESDPPTLRMKVTAPTQKKSVFAALNKRGAPLRPMVQLQEGCDAFFSHVRFEYEVEYQDELPDEDLSPSLSNSPVASAAAAGAESLLASRRTAKSNSMAAGKQPAMMELRENDAELERLLLEREKLLRNNKMLEHHQEMSNADEFVVHSEIIKKQPDVAQQPSALAQDNSKSSTSVAASPKNRNAPAASQSASGGGAASPLLNRPALPLKACAVDVSGAGTQATFNACAIISGGHGLVFRCTATSVGAQGSTVQSPRVALRDGCHFESSNGTCVVVAAQDSGFALAAAARDNVAATSMHSSSRALRPPEGIIHIARCSFNRSMAGIEISGPVHVKLTDCDFEACRVALAAAACMPMQLQVTETLFARCGLGTIVEAPAGAGSSRDIGFSDCRYDQCDRGLVLEGPDCTVAVDGCVFTRCSACGVCVDGGKSSAFTNCILQQNDVAVEVIDGKPTFANNTFHGNTAAGAIVSGNTATPTFRENTFTNTGEGGAVSTRNRLNSDHHSLSSAGGGGAGGLGSHRKAVRCAAMLVEHDATPLVEYNRFENNSGANCLILSAFGVFTDNSLGAPGTDSYNVVVSGARACPKLQFNMFVGNDRGQARPTLCIEDGAAAVAEQNDFASGRSSALVCRRSGEATVFSHNRISSRFLEGGIISEKSRGVACKNDMGELTFEVFQDSKSTFEIVR